MRGSLRAFDVAVLASGFGLVSLPAFAYIDPGTASAAIQIIVAVVAGVAVSARLFLGKIKEFFGSLRGRGDKGEQS